MKTALSKKIISVSCGLCDGTGQDFNFEYGEKVFVTDSSCPSCSGTGQKLDHKGLAKKGFLIVSETTPMWTIIFDHLNNKMAKIDSPNYDYDRWKEIPNEEIVAINLYTIEGVLRYSGLISGFDEYDEIVHQILERTDQEGDCTTLHYYDKQFEVWKQWE